MLTKFEMQEIQKLKQMGYSKQDVVKYYEDKRKKGQKVPSLPTINKYYDMEVLPEDPTANYAKHMAFDKEPFRGKIISILQENPKGTVCTSSIYDVLVEVYTDPELEEPLEMPGTDRALRNYVNRLEESGMIVHPDKPGRIYTLVDGIGPGEQMLIDFGQKSYGKNKELHFICLLLRYSRYLCVYVQDHKYSSIEACTAINRCFQHIGGRPTEIVIDQDSVFVAKEVHGECTFSEVFGNFVDEQQLKVYVCNKADPESKGGAESSVAFFKKSFLSARPYTSIEDFREKVSKWMVRKNNRIHGTTCKIPAYVLEHEEKDFLKPLLPSVFDITPSSFHTVKIQGVPFITYKSCKYALPWDYVFKPVNYKVIGDKILIYDENYEYLYTHTVSKVAGAIVKVPEFMKPKSTAWKNIADRLKDKWDCPHMQEFTDGLYEAQTRYAKDQLSAIEKLLESENPDNALVASVLEECCAHQQYSESAFMAFFNRMKAEKSVNQSGHAESPANKPVQKQDMSFYEKAVKDRTVGKEDVI
ncbi:MAG: hypothetical protein LUD72_13220 [Bacteroidales bacterium]|nr:hypothetical protein [Bacteroidales bacterium]